MLILRRMPDNSTREQSVAKSMTFLFAGGRIGTVDAKTPVALVCWRNYWGEIGSSCRFAGSVSARGFFRWKDAFVFFALRLAKEGILFVAANEIFGWCLQIYF
ncbi:hypothetical protein NPIL_97811 [Nephila pilipes]|uniref:Uncharacterized protein n=1 Tax=Nephila pilipes TaxID=299642 RepID=A0A8X6T1D8_NEPPI|nr:hypothetical protein NPIL_97811 [Nephila pilipes]